MSLERTENKVSGGSTSLVLLTIRSPKPKRLNLLGARPCGELPCKIGLESCGSGCDIDLGRVESTSNITLLHQGVTTHTRQELTFTAEQSCDTKDVYSYVCYLSPAAHAFPRSHGLASSTHLRFITWSSHRRQHTRHNPYLLILRSIYVLLHYPTACNFRRH